MSSEHSKQPNSGPTGKQTHIWCRWCPFCCESDSHRISGAGLCMPNWQTYHDSFSLYLSHPASLVELLRVCGHCGASLPDDLVLSCRVATSETGRSIAVLLDARFALGDLHSHWSQPPLFGTHYTLPSYRLGRCAFGLWSDVVESAGSGYSRAGHSERCSKSYSSG